MRKLCVCTGCVLFLALLCRYSTDCADAVRAAVTLDRKSTRLNSSHRL